MTMTRDIHGEISAPLGDAMRAASQAGEVTYLRWRGMSCTAIILATIGLIGASS